MFYFVVKNSIGHSDTIWRIFKTKTNKGVITKEIPVYLFMRRIWCTGKIQIPHVNVISKEYNNKT